MLSFAVNLTPRERMTTPTLGTERGAMVKSFEVSMHEHPELVPRYVNTDRLAADLALWRDLLEISARAREVCELVEDTLHLTGNDVLTAFLGYYQSVRQAARRNVPGADTIAADLSRFFARRRRRDTARKPPAP